MILANDFFKLHWHEHTPVDSTRTESSFKHPGAQTKLTKTEYLETLQLKAFAKQLNAHYYEDKNIYSERIINKRKLVTLA